MPGREGLGKQPRFVELPNETRNRSGFECWRYWFRGAEEDEADVNGFKKMPKYSRTGHPSRDGLLTGKGVPFLDESVVAAMPVVVYKP